MPVVAGEIQVLQREEVVHVEPIGPYAIMIGRSPDNDLRLAEKPEISLAHLDGQRLLVD